MSPLSNTPNIHFMLKCINMIDYYIIVARLFKSYCCSFHGCPTWSIIDYFEVINLCVLHGISVYEIFLCCLIPLTL